MGKRLEPVRLVADLSSQTPRRGAEFEFVFVLHYSIRLHGAVCKIDVAYIHTF